LDLHFAGIRLKLLAELPDESINLVVTSPPFRVAKRKKNISTDRETRLKRTMLHGWAKFGALVFKKLRPDGSFVLDIGGAYVKGSAGTGFYIRFRVFIEILR